MSGIRLCIGCERKAVVLFGLASEPVLQFLQGRKICAKKTQSIEIIAEYYIIQLSRLRLLDCLSCFVESALDVWSWSSLRMSSKHSICFLGCSGDRIIESVTTSTSEVLFLVSRCFLLGTCFMR